jgi:hypothetical protein
MGEAILVSLLFALACRTRVPIFDIKSAHVAHVLVCIPLHFVCIYFAWSPLSAVFLLEHTGSNEYLRHMVLAPVDCLFQGIIIHTHRNYVLLCVLLHLHSLQTIGAYCSTLVDSGVMLGVGRSVVERMRFVAVASLQLHLGTHLPMTSLPFGS